MFRPLILALAGAALVGATVAVAQQPTTSPTPAATPTASPTAQPAPPAVENLSYHGEMQIVRPDGSFIPPEEREVHVTLAWDAPAGFTGSYQVFRLQAGPGTPAALVGTVPATGVAGTLSYSETVRWTLGQQCYQVRATIGSATGPTAEYCTPRPPSSGPGAVPTPIAPADGNAGLARDRSWHGPLSPQWPDIASVHSPWPSVRSRGLIPSAT